MHLPDWSCSLARPAPRFYPWTPAHSHITMQPQRVVVRSRRIRDSDRRFGGRHPIARNDFAFEADRYCACLSANPRALNLRTSYIAVNNLLTKTARKIVEQE